MRVEWPGHRGNAVNVVVDRTTATDREGQPGDQRAVEARVAAFVKQQLANFRPHDDIAVQTWTVAGPAVPPMGSAADCSNFDSKPLKRLSFVPTVVDVDLAGDCSLVALT